MQSFVALPGTFELLTTLSSGLGFLVGAILLRRPEWLPEDEAPR